MMAQCERKASNHGQHGNQGHHSLHNKCRDIYRCHNKPEAHLCDNDLITELMKGVLFGTSLFWLDANLRICSEKFARGLTITWGSTPEYWTYKMHKLSNGYCVEVAQLQKVCWLEVQGDFNANMLAPNTEYEVLFDVKMLPCAYGWDHPVKFTLTTPEGCVINSEKCLKQFIGQQCYKEIPIGKFHTHQFQNGCQKTVGFKLQELNGQWKSGLVVRGVIIRPAAKCGC